MSEGEPLGAAPLPPAEGDAAPQRRPRRRRRGPRPSMEALVATPSVEAAEPRPMFQPLDAEGPAPAAVELGLPAPVNAVGPEGVEPRPSRRPRRRRTPTDGEAVSTAAFDVIESAEAVEAHDLVADENEVSVAPAAGRGRAKRAAASPVAVNVDVPRGLGRRVNSKLIQQVAQLALQREGWSLPGSLDVLIVADDEMREINVTRRGIDEATDVLSFPLLELRPETGLAEDFFVLPPETQVHLGDIVISFSRVESQADEAGHSRERELAFLTVHAVLHILGYDHDTEEKRRRMRRREEDVLVEIGLRRNGS